MSGSEIFFICEKKSMFVSVLRSRSAIGDIGTIEYDALRTVNVLQIEDINDNRPEFNITSLTVGYPSAEIAHQLLPPYLMKVQVMRARAGFLQGNISRNWDYFIHQSDLSEDIPKLASEMLH
jgi:hypothetical protein